MRRPSLTIDATLLGQQSSRAARGLTSRPSFTEADRQGSTPDDDLAHIAVLLHGATDSSDDTSSSGVLPRRLRATKRSWIGGCWPSVWEHRWQSCKMAVFLLQHSSIFVKCCQRQKTYSGKHKGMGPSTPSGIMGF